MGCAESKDAPAKPVERKPAAATPSQPKEQSAPSKPPPTAPEVAVPAQSPPSAPLPALASSLKKPATFNAGIYATSTDRRIQEVEFFRNIVKQTEDEFMDVSQSALDYHDGDEDDGGIGPQLRAIAVAPERMEFAGMPRPSAKNQDHVTALLSSSGLSAQRLAGVDAAVTAILAGVQAVAMRDVPGKSMVAQFHAVQ